MGKRTWLISLSLFLVCGVAEAWAQQRPIIGRVLSSATNQGLAGATVSVFGTAVQAVTGDDGRFALSAPEGGVTLVVRLIGYKRR